MLPQRLYRASGFIASSCRKTPFISLRLDCDSLGQFFTCFRGQGGATPADEIRAQLDLPTRIVNDILYQLVQAGQLIAVPSGDGEREVAFAPAHDPQSMTVYGILEAVEKSGQTTVDLTQSAELTRIDQELETLKETARKSQDNVRLVDLL